ncbi:hypothetical protein V494_08261 [Pseudogymnoascus sp. VKM F-4513 (FW-928)]|nr:hypothetical protein V494_08261 [Pseudogymnoascus sp. VKM F-4513 (FW-928)]
MRLCYHGVSPSSRLLAKSQTSMSSFTGTTNLANDAMRSLAALRAKPPATAASARPQNLGRLWNPAQGIVFGNSEAGLRGSSPRAFSTTTLSTLEGSTTSIENTYTLSGKENSTSSQESDQGIQSQSSTTSSWAPSAQDTEGSQTDQSQAKVPQQQEAVTEEQKLSDEAEVHTPLSFAVPADVLQKAKDAAPDTPDSFWTHRLYTGPDNAKVKVHYCKSRHTTESVLQKHFLGKPILGFDIEWKIDATRFSSPKKNVSLIQLACEDRIILSHLALFPKDGVNDLVAPTLKAILEDPNVSKCGVAIKADCTRVRKFLKIDTHGIFELSHLHRLIEGSAARNPTLINKKLVSLTSQASEHLALPIFKGEVRGSDWSEPLSMEQILYAASDAYAGFILYDVLEAKRKALRPTPPRPYHAELNLPIRLASGIEIVTADESLDDATAALEPRKTSKSAPQDPSLSIPLEADDDASPSPQPQTPKRPAKKAERPADPRVDAAAAFAVSYRAEYPSSTAAPAALRAYHIWSSHESLSVADIAGLLRDPPLKVGTVRGYILEALRLEGRGVLGSGAGLRGERGLDIKGREDRVRELLEGVEGDTSGWRWRGLWRIIGGERKSNKAT